MRKLFKQTNRLYVITQFSEGSIWLKYHLEATKYDDIDKIVKIKKDEILSKIEKDLDLPPIIEDETINNLNDRIKDYEKRKYSFSSFSDFRLNRLVQKIGIDKTRNIKQNLDLYKKQSSMIELEGNTPLLKMSKANWNFILEGKDFEMNLDGTIDFKL